MPGTGLIFERVGKGRCEERSTLADDIPDRRLDLARSERHCRSFG